jgi:glycine hydroxymethyltransferase
MVLGGAMPHVMVAKAVALAEARTPDFADYAHRIVANANASPRTSAAAVSD